MKPVRFMMLLFVFLVLVPAQRGIAKDKIVLNTMESAPYQSESLKDGGFLVRLSKEAFKRTGYDLIVVFVPWKRAMVEAKNGIVDGVMGAWYNKERTEFFSYTDWIGESTLTFIKRKEDLIEFESLQDLKGYHIGIVDGYTYTEAFDKAAFLNKQMVHSTELNVRMLFKKRVDLIPDVEQVVQYIVKSKFNHESIKLESVGKPLKIHKIFNLISKKNPKYKKITQDFNQGLKLVREDGSYDAILNTYGIHW